MNCVELPKKIINDQRSQVMVQMIWEQDVTIVQYLLIWKNRTHQGSALSWEPVEYRIVVHHLVVRLNAVYILIGHFLKGVHQILVMRNTQIIKISMTPISKQGRRPHLLYLVKLMNGLVTITKLHPNKLIYLIEVETCIAVLNFIKIKTVAKFACHGMLYDGFPCWLWHLVEKLEVKPKILY